MLDDLFKDAVEKKKEKDAAKKEKKDKDGDVNMAKWYIYYI